MNQSLSLCYPPAFPLLFSQAQRKRCSPAATSVISAFRAVLKPLPCLESLPFCQSISVLSSKIHLLLRVSSVSECQTTTFLCFWISGYLLLSISLSLFHVHSLVSTYQLTCELQKGGDQIFFFSFIQNWNGQDHMQSQQGPWFCTQLTDKAYLPHCRQYGKKK